MCCLKYEEEVYSEKAKRLPKVGAIVKSEEGTGEVVSVETLKELIRVKYQDGEETFYKKHDVKDIVVIKDAQEDDRIVADSEEDLEELKNLEKLEKADKNNQEDEI
jgi:cell fate regulator YaaT (PSP1 superfamily)